jgi:hypothetical protein
MPSLQLPEKKALSDGCDMRVRACSLYDDAPRRACESAIVPHAGVAVSPVYRKFAVSGAPCPAKKQPLSVDILIV